MTHPSTPRKHNAYAQYAIGFLLSLCLTASAYALVERHAFTHHTVPTHSVAIGLLLLLAVIQLAVQLVFFLHIDRESRPRWRTVSFLFAALVVCIVVIGSLWIMGHLNYHPTVSPEHIDQAIIEDEGIH